MDSETPDTTNCAKCAASLRTSAQFCTRCGAPTEPQVLESPAEAAEAATTPQPAWTPEPTTPSVGRSHELRAVAWLYGLMLFTSLSFGIAYHVQPQGDFLPWFTLIDAV